MLTTFISFSYCSTMPPGHVAAFDQLSKVVSVSGQAEVSKDFYLNFSYSLKDNRCLIPPKHDPVIKMKTRTELVNIFSPLEQLNVCPSLLSLLYMLVT